MGSLIEARPNSRTTPAGISQSMKKGRERYFPNASPIIAHEAPRKKKIEVHTKRKASVEPSSSSQGLLRLNENPSRMYAYSDPAFVIIVPSSAYERAPNRERMAPVIHTIITSPNEFV